MRADWVVPPTIDSDRVVLFVHGGAFLFGSKAAYTPIAAQLAALCRRRFFNVEYRLAPEHVFPDAVHDVASAYLYLLHVEQIPASRIVFMGDSAGGNLVLSATIFLREQGHPMPAGVSSLGNGPDGVGAYDYYVGRDQHGPETVRIAATHHMVSPVLDRGSARVPWPPVYLSTGTDERLLDDNVRFAAKLARFVDHGRASVVVHDLFVDQPHVFPLVAIGHPDTRRVHQRIASFLTEVADVKSTRPPHRVEVSLFADGRLLTRDAARAWGPRWAGIAHEHGLDWTPSYTAGHERRAQAQAQAPVPEPVLDAPGRGGPRPHPSPRARAAARKAANSTAFWADRRAAVAVETMPRRLPRELQVSKAEREARVRMAKRRVRAYAEIDVQGLSWLDRLVRLQRARDYFVDRELVSASTPRPRMVPKLEVDAHGHDDPVAVAAARVRVAAYELQDGRTAKAYWDYLLHWSSMYVKHLLCWRLQPGAQPVNQFIGSIKTDGYSARVPIYRDGIYPCERARSTPSTHALSSAEHLALALESPPEPPVVAHNDPPLVISHPPDHRVARRRGAGTDIHAGDIDVAEGIDRITFVDPGANSPITAFTVALVLFFYIVAVLERIAMIHADGTLDDDARAAELDAVRLILLDIAMTNEGINHRFDQITVYEFNHKTGARLKSSRSRMWRAEYGLDDHDEDRSAASHPAADPATYLHAKIDANAAAEAATLTEVRRTRVGRLGFFTFGLAQKMFDKLTHAFKGAYVLIGHQFHYGGVRVHRRGPVAKLVDQLVRRGTKIARVDENYTSKRCAVCSALSTPQQRADGECDLETGPRTPWGTKHCPRCRATFGRDKNAAFNLLLIHAHRLRIAQAQAQAQVV
ncbi:hypothetical protein H9P43_001163 [Blastocladiella emersonii ATCC 22665]|nr:hypothetical protein H9P43_001163 [Blastocladiella emersonii ATCC 22665]